MKIICDFDGTTAVNDVGNLLFRTFADERCYEIVAAWKTGKINSKECLEQECAITEVSRQELETFADEQDLDPDFPAFVNFCNEHQIEVEIASDGLDFYIERVLKKYKLQETVTAKANHLVFTGEKKISAEFPYFIKGCGHCGNCKGLHVKMARQSNKKVVYIGDGLSDRCGAEEADIVFAKRGRDLISFCRDSNIAHYEYDDFAEILRDYKKLFV